MMTRNDSNDGENEGGIMVKWIQNDGENRGGMMVK
jgi:hypothetical protein